MTRNQLPEGVGKKIVEALKRQAEADISPIEEIPAAVGNNLPLTEQEVPQEINAEEPVIETNDDVIVEESEELVNVKDEDIINQPLFTLPEPEQKAEENIVQPQVNIVQPQVQEQQLFFSKTPLNQERLEKTVMEATSQVTMPANVATLRKLIMGLPAGVTKQTGAQIIKQTFEAMGMPISSVLKEAQMFQEELNSSTREYMIKIQEYKTQIMQLEKAVQDYQQHISQVNDLISLFLSSER